MTAQTGRRCLSCAFWGWTRIALHKGRGNYVTIVSTQDESGSPVLLAVLEGRAKAVVKNFLLSIPERLRVQVKQVCSDLYEGFINAAREVLPQAKVVADRFHVAKLYRGALEKLRQSELKRLRKGLSEEEYKGLKGVMWALRRRAEDLSVEEQELLSKLFVLSPALREAYRLREELTKIFESSQSLKSGQKALQKWLDKVLGSGVTCFETFCQTLKERLVEIANYFVSRLTSGWVEGFNNKLKVIKRRCYGLGSAGSLYRRVWLDLNGRKAFAG